MPQGARLAVTSDSRRIVASRDRVDLRPENPEEGRGERVSVALELAARKLRLEKRLG